MQNKYVGIIITWEVRGWMGRQIVLKKYRRVNNDILET